MKTKILIAALALGLAPACSEDGKQQADAGPDSGEACQWDEDSEPAAANAVGFGSAVEGFICPQADQDWYALTIASGSQLLRIDLSVDAPVSPLNLTYGVWDGAAAEVLHSPLSTESAIAGEPLSIVHRLEAGSYYLVVRDRGDDAEDVWHPYYLTLDAFPDPDENEVNNTPEQATPSGSGSIQGFIAYRGDQDWYRIDAEAHDLLHVQLTMPAGGIEPSFQVIDAESEMLVTQVNEAGKFEATDLSYVQALPDAAAYYVVVRDDDDLDYDYGTPYSLELSLSPDPDANEANDHPNDATALGALQCSAFPSSWSDWVTNAGYLASSGDIDWFELELSNCGRSLIEVEVDFESPGSLPAELQATARLVRRVDFDSYACELDSECVELPKACDYGLDCRLMGNTCLTSGVCAGAGACIDPGQCGVNYISEAAPEATPGSVTVSAPLYGWTSPFPLFLAVADYQADAYSIDHSYTIRARVRRDPDLNELPSEAYTAGPPEADDPAAEHIEFAQEIPIHDCTLADCCTSGTWVEGSLSYAYDQDWYAYPHPCPGQDCMVRVVYDFDSGPVDFYMQVYEGANPWFDNLSDTTDPGDQPARSGYFGGLDAADYCFYAYSGHEGDPFYYYLPIRDTIYVAEGQEEDGTWDWSPEQGYRFCVEKIADGCIDPCFLYEDGCGSP